MKKKIVLAADVRKIRCRMALVLVLSVTTCNTQLQSVATRRLCSSGCPWRSISVTPRDWIVAGHATPLFVAAAEGHEAVARALVDLGADLNKAKDNGTTPLFVAAQNAHEVVVQALVKAGADVNKAADDGCTPLFVAAQNGHGAVVRALMEAGADGPLGFRYIFLTGLHRKNIGAKLIVIFLLLPRFGGFTGTSIWSHKNPSQKSPAQNEKKTKRLESEKKRSTRAFDNRRK